MISNDNFLPAAELIIILAHITFFCLKHKTSLCVALNISGGKRGKNEVKIVFAYYFIISYINLN